MTAVAIPQRPGLLPVPLALARQEGRRILLHPVALLGLALTVTVLGLENEVGPRAAFDLAATSVTYFYAVFVFFAASLVASRDRRSHTRELLAATPAPAPARVAALCLGALAPALLAAVVVITIHALTLARGVYEVAPTGWHLAQGPLTVLGGALLGVMVGRLSTVPGVALLVMVAMVVADLWLAGNPHGLGLLSTYVSWAVWETSGHSWAGVIPGSPAWHVGYLASLCAMAAAGAFLRDAADSRRVLAIGAACTAAAVVTGFLQLP